ncbi:putative leucine-rich repeat receptor-like serine/threonine-protein kinase At2g24130 [Selaginella moellendorffii]|nr:putative leucine-rich repeat receptor-like serine/threonine-protein kinase At2g24130 [Selaginella moellendorffii]|eukprot:XP_002990056.2 putative leucine-rich repeat receptor-like serine/threonine-protein kinase At2g24130 [Selaginella moellendorffii]
MELKTLMSVVLLLLAMIRIAVSWADKNSLQDAMALMEFKSTVWYDPLNTFATWQATGVLGEHPCNFKGVECDMRRMRIKYVDISGCQLRGIVPSVLGNITLAWGFNLSHNEFIGTIPRGFGRMPNLKYLDLSNNFLTGFMPTDLAKLQFLNFYSLANNQLTGFLGFLNMSSLRRLDLSNNSFRGPVPESYGTLLPNLTQLDLSRNKLTGPIPKSLGYLDDLRRLDLSRNLLTGNIPYSLAMATGLNMLRLKYNFLTGRVPDTDTMRLFAKAFFPGNDGLCGPVVERACPSSQVWKQVLMGLFLPPLILSVLTGVVYLVAPPDEFSLSTIRSVTDNFNNNKILGDGGLCTIYKGVFLNGKTVAVKRLRPEYYNDNNKIFDEERRFLKAVNHPNIVKYLGACSSPKLKVLVYEHMANGTLDMHLHKERGGLSSLSWSSRMNIAAGVAQGLAYLHGEWNEPQAMHCDLRGRSVLLDDKFNAHISDIRSKNTSLAFTNPEKSIGTSTGYLPPGGHTFIFSCFFLLLFSHLCITDGAEYATDIEPTTEGEVFSFGTLLMELLTGTEPAAPVENDVEGGLQGIMEQAFPDNLQSVLDPAIMGRASYDQIVLCTKIALECTKANPEERPKMEDVLRMFEQAYSLNTPALDLNDLLVANEAQYLRDQNPTSIYASTNSITQDT